MTLDCLSCGGPYEQERRRASHFCPDCRKARHRERMAAAQRELYEARRSVDDRLDTYRALGMSDEYVQRYRDDLDELAVGMRAYASPRDTVPDRMPPGANAPTGPDDGCSTGWKDLQAELDERAFAAASHPWFAENPHWSFELHDPERYEAARSRTLRAS